ncbi:T-cell surface glycoprotein CD8 alpha chain [Arvicola amphibius]|uniref:T-cell surface glycoprotein CD8 alpha chain n=1 Tax=Arvicola amphibius TaxID=1047088 RepID=UPI0018E37AFA|nr:T-cell surface glycoprotein CD8 alpha chain [Arvicola amphibius]
MASPVTCILSLTLLLDLVAELQGSEQLQISSLKKSPELGKELKLKCSVLLSTSQGCTWLFQKDGSGVKPTFLLYLSTTKIKVNDQLDENQFSGNRNDKEYTLILKKFGEENQGYYFCSVTGNSVVYFSPLLPVFLPGKPTTPVPRPRTPVPTVGTSRSPRPQTCRPGPGASVEKRGLDFDCNIFIWAPLAGICGVLLLSLVITLICCHRNRRRVCKCPRPLVRQAGKPSPSEKFV